MAQITRRSFVKNVALGAVGASALGAGAALATADEAAGLVPGTYKATAQGFMGFDTVCVTVDENSITDVILADSTDYPPFVVEAVRSTIPARIFDAQSVNVDVVAGATFSSMAVMEAVADCIAQAGGAGMFETAPERPAPESAQDLDTDVLVIGAGGAGILAALSAKYADFEGGDSGLSVTLVEKLDFFGGSTLLSGGGFIAATPLSEQPSEDSAPPEAPCVWRRRRGSARLFLRGRSPIQPSFPRGG